MANEELLVPEFKWAQNRKDIYVQIVVIGVDPKSMKTDITKDTFYFRGDANKKAYELKFKFSHNINPNTVKYKVSRLVEFVFEKESDDSFWDSLLGADDKKRLKNRCTIDWSRWVGEEDLDDEDKLGNTNDYSNLMGGMGGMPGMGGMGGMPGMGGMGGMGGMPGMGGMGGMGGMPGMGGGGMDMNALQEMMKNMKGKGGHDHDHGDHGDHDHDHGDHDHDNEESDDSDDDPIPNIENNDDHKHDENCGHSHGKKEDVAVSEKSDQQNESHPDTINKNNNDAAKDEEVDVD